MGVLDGIKVLELGRVFSGPLCGMVLADLGASVLKVERPGVGDESRRFGPHEAGGQSCYFNALNRGKKSVALDLARDEDRALFLELVEKADVLVHNWVEASLVQLGLSPDALRASSPRLITCSIGGYGAGTTFADRPAQDVVAQALSGFMSLTGEAGGAPLKTAIPVVDYATGLYAAFAIMAALYRRERLGVGQHVSISLLEAALAMTSFAASAFLSAGALPRRVGNRHPSICPYNTYATADGHVVVAVANDAMWARLCEALGLDALAEDSRFASNAARLDDQEALEPLLAARIAALPTTDVTARLEAHRVSVSPVNELSEAFASREVRELDMTLRWGGASPVEVVGSPLRLDGDRPRPFGPPPALGEHDAEVRENRDW